MSTHFLNANLAGQRDGKTIPPRVFARDRATDEPIWLNFPFSDKNKVAALHAAITEAKTQGAHWVIDIDALALAVEEGSIEVTDAGHTAIVTTAAQVLQYAQCVQNNAPDEVDDEFATLLAAKAQPVAQTVVSSTDDEDDPFGS